MHLTALTLIKHALHLLMCSNDWSVNDNSQRTGTHQSERRGCWSELTNRSSYPTVSSDADLCTLQWGVALYLRVFVFSIPDVGAGSHAVVGKVSCGLMYPLPTQVFPEVDVQASHTAGVLVAVEGAILTSCCLEDHFYGWIHISHQCAHCSCTGEGFPSHTRPVRVRQSPR